jgi:hypothetical protein
MTSKHLIMALGLVAIAGCDSGLAYKANLGQTGAPPTLTATETVVLTGGTPSGLLLTFDAPEPSEWATAQSLKLLIASVPYPITKAAGSFIVGLPLTASQKNLASASVPMTFIVDNDHVMTTKVTVK